MFENDTDDSASNVCVKGGFNPDNRESLPFLYAIYRLEAEFYYYLAQGSRSLFHRYRMLAQIL
ncbi:hypothetical protein BFJ70_g844 [Fusarium oxysporum]|nr:hypothetical protein BFJ70_g844 [Fusarium oxysporum]